MDHSFHERRLGQRAYQPRQRHVGSRACRADWLRQLYTPRWRYHLTILLVSLTILPFGLRSGQSLHAGGDSALSWLQSDARRPAVRYHEVAPGESLKAIAEQYGISVETLRWANGLAEIDSIAIGQELLILPADGVLHFLGAGESARQVALYYGADPDEVAAYNGIADPDRPLRAAQLMVPNGRPRLTQAVASTGLVGWVSANLSNSAERPEGATLLQFGDRTIALVEDPERTDAVARAATAPAKTWEEIQQEAERATAAAVAASKRKPPAPAEYEVQPGDTILGLAERYGVSPLTIIAANGLLNSDALRVGQSLVIPPVTGVIYRVQENDTLSEIAQRFRVDLGPIVDYNLLDDQHALSVGQRLIIPGAEPERPKPPPPPAPPAPTAVPAAPAAPARQAAPGGMVAGGSSGSGFRLATSSAPTRPAPRAEPPSIPVPAASGKGGELVSIAMRYLGHRYVFGGTTPAGFDCSGFVYFVHRSAGIPLSRGMMGQYTAGPKVPRDALQPGDIVFFSNTYMPGLSHNGIYIGGGKFIHASDESTGVVVTSLSSAYWASRYSGAARVY